MADRFHLQPKHRRILEALLREHLPDVEVWAYGSRVNGRSHDGSDLDLVLRGPGLAEIPTGQLGDFEDAVRESSIPFLVEARDWTRLPERFHREIKQNYAILLPDAGLASENNNWITLLLGDVCTKIGSGATPRGGKEVYDKSGSISLIRSQNVYNCSFKRDGIAYITDEQARRLSNVEVQLNDVLLNITGDSVARTCQVSLDVLPARVNQHVAIIRPDPYKLSALFLRYFLVCPKTQSMLLSWAGSGGTRNALTKGMIESFQIRVPEDVTEQEAIARILGTLDDKIESNRRMNETLEGMSRALFKSWFVDFDPVRAKMERRDTGLPRDIADLFPDRLVASELGEIPEGWAMKPLSDVANFLNGLALQKFPANNPADSLPVIKIAELRNGITDKSDKASSGIPDKYIVRDGDFIFSWSGSLLAKFWTEGEGALNQHLFKVTSDRYPPWFYAAWIQIHLNEFRRIAAFKATTMGHIQRNHLQSAITTCPPDNVINKLGVAIEPLIKSTIENQIRSRTLADLRQTLLPKLISGELRVNDISRSTELAK